MPLLSNVVFSEILSYIETSELLPLRLTSKSFNQLITPKVWYTFNFLGKDLTQVEHYLIKNSNNISTLIISYIPFEVIQNYIKYFVVLEKVIIESANKELVNSILSSFLIYKPNLKSIHINSIVSEFIDYNILKQFHQLDNFILQNTSLKGAQTSAIIESIANRNLKQLKLIVGSINLESIHQIANKFPDLRSFYLKGSLTSSDICDTFTLPKFPILLQLSLIVKESSCKSIKIEENHFEKLKELRLEQERWPKISFKIMGVFRNINKVHLEFFEDGLGSLVNKLPNLQSAILKDSLKMEDCEDDEKNEGNRMRVPHKYFITESLIGFTKLKSLNICAEESGFLNLICKNILPLECLELKNIALDKSLLEYLQFKGQNLRKLALMCCEFTDELIEYLKMNIKPFELDNLTSLEFDCYSPVLFNVLFNVLTGICPNLNVSSKAKLNNISNYYNESGVDRWNQSTN